MSFFRRDEDQEGLEGISDLDYFCWLGGSALVMVAMGVLAIRMATFSPWLTVQWWPNLVVTALASIMWLPLWGGLAFLAWGWLTGRALTGMDKGRSGILFLISPVLASIMLQALGLLSWWWGRDVVVADPLIVYCTAIAVLLLVLPPTGIHWRRKEKTS